MKAARLIIAVFALLLTAATAFAQGSPAVMATVNPTEGTVGDVFTYTAEITWPQDLSVLPPDPKDALGPFSILSRQISDLVQENGINKLIVTLTLACYETGPQIIPALEVPYTDPSGEEVVELGPELKVNILRTLPEDAAEIRDIKGQREMPPDLLTPLLIALAALAVAAVIFILLARYRRRKKKEEIARIEKPEPFAHARSRLASGKLEQLLDKLEVEAFYEELTDILREYLEGRYEVYALELTTREIARAIKPLNFDGFLKTELLKVLERADYAKFARLNPDLPTCREDLENGRGFVEKTRPELGPQTEEADK
jgi:hypothetical protein